MTSTTARPVRRRSRAAVALLAALAVVAVGLGVTSAEAAVDTPTVKADSSSSTALKVSWPAVKGAASYRVQYSTTSAFTSASVLPAAGKKITDTSTTITGLSVNKTYYVRVADVSAAGKVGTMSRAAAAAPRYPFAAPGDLVRTKVTKSSMTVSWKAVSGAPGYTVRAYSKGNPTRYVPTTGTSVSLTGLKSNTTYYLRAYVSRPNEVLSATSPEVTTKTSTYAVAAPDGLHEAWQSAYSVGLAWTGVAGLPAGGGYRVSYALDAAQTDHDKSTATVRSTSTTLTGLTVDTTYFATIWAVDKTGKRASLSSDFIVAKSRVPRGTLSGKVDGVTGSDLTAAAYDSSGNVAKAVTVGSDNAYSLDVRPGTYKVQLMYTGTGGYASAWARADSSGAWTISQASKAVVTQGKTTALPKVTIKEGHKLSGTVVDTAGRAVRDVDVTAISAAGTEREVIAMTRSGADGKFTLSGLSSGAYWFRFVYGGDGFTVLSSPMTVTKDAGIRAVLGNATFRSQYKAYINGSHKVGKTLSVHALPWLAGSYPTTKASMSYQWKRNGAAIKGATRSTYKLGSADRGKTITITVTARRYGYTTGTATSKGAHIS